MPAIIDRGDRLALYLSTEERPIVPQGAFDEQDCLPQSHALPAIAIPCTVRHRLIGFVLYGAHINGAQPDKKDVELLREIVERATAAYDHVAVVERTNENRELRAEVELLRSLLAGDYGARRSANMQPISRADKNEKAPRLRSGSFDPSR